MPEGPKHFLTVDVEDSFHSEEPDPTSWDRHPLRVEASTHAVLERCERTGARGTFFVLGWIAERLPKLVKDIAAAGHEVASHGYGHQFVNRQGRVAFEEDVRRARQILENHLGAQVRGYRAPYFSIVERTPWAYDALVAAGYEYSSSVFPGSNPRYGIRGHGQEPVEIRTASGASILEIPVTSFFSRIGCGGVYFRALPFRFFTAALTARQRSGGRAVFYIHPWELDPGKPAAPGSAWLRWRHDVGIRGAAARLDRLLHAFEFEPIAAARERGDLPRGIHGAHRGRDPSAITSASARQGG